MWDFIKGLHEVRNPAIGFTGEKKIAGRGKNNFKEPEVRSHLIGLMKSKEVSIARRDTDEFIKTAREQIIDRTDSCFE